jgi:hypothetical protein
MGMHNSRKLQLEQATLMAWGFMVYLMVGRWICLRSSLELKPKIPMEWRRYPFDARIHQKQVKILTSVNAWKKTIGQSGVIVWNIFLSKVDTCPSSNLNGGCMSTCHDLMTLLALTLTKVPRPTVATFAARTKAVCLPLLLRSQ